MRSLALVPGLVLAVAVLASGQPAREWLTGQTGRGTARWTAWESDVNHQKRILFVCLHGAAKSVLAAADLRRLAAARGLDLEADAVGTEPDPEIAPAVIRALLAEGVDLRGQPPGRVTPDDVVAASRVVAFACDLADVAPPMGRVEQWTDVPAVSEDLPVARAAIRRHLERLVDEYARTGVYP